MGLESRAKENSARQKKKRGRILAVTAKWLVQRSALLRVSGVLKRKQWCGPPGLPCIPSVSPGWVSRTTVRNRTIERAPTRLNARATLSPMTCVTMAIKIDSSTRVTGSEEESWLILRVCR